MKQRLLILLITLLPFLTNAKGYWTNSIEKEVPALGQKVLHPDAYLLSKLNVSAFSIFQSNIPLESAGVYPTVSLPAPNGQFMDFYIYENATMAPMLKSKYPNIKAYTLIHTKNAWITGKLEFASSGLHAKVFNKQETYFIDPYKNGSKEWYQVYYKKDFSKPLNDRMHCLLEEEETLGGNPIQLNEELPLMNNSSYKTFGVNRRTFRLALACTEEYSAAVGGATPTKASVLAAMVTTMNRVNGVFEREFSMTATLIGNTDDLIYLPGTNDPYTNSSGSAMLGQNQSTINSIIGSSNYDFGHVFSTGGGGIASLGSVCRNNKARGVTGLPNPVGDPFDIDYVAHEMGHQFGGSHTFNSSSGSCSGNGSSSSAYEPGSATTIQGYAGICGSDNIQNNSDDYYHARSIFQMYTHLENNGNCAASVASSNNPPTVTDISLQTYVIPYKTPFELEATASDADGDPITFCWEQYDNGSFGAWNVPNLDDEPLFRSFYPTNSPIRTFPQRTDLMLNRIDVKGEVLPEVAREVTFRLMVRDIRNGFGTFNRSDNKLEIDVVNTAPDRFAVTSQAVFGAAWTGDTQETITWDVAGTDVGAINTPNVDVYLSIDTGKTWPYILASNTPNDGSESILVPNINTTRARVKVKGHNNIFFDLNDVYIQINQQVYPTAVNDYSNLSIDVFPNPAKHSIEVRGLEGYSLSGLSFFNMLGQEVKMLNTQDSVHDISDMAAGVYVLKAQTKENTIFEQKVVIQ